MGQTGEGIVADSRGTTGLCLWLLVSADTAYVRISISDVNDNQPVFARGVYEVNVAEDQDVGSTILTVTANDEDEGKALHSHTALSKV